MARRRNDRRHRAATATAYAATLLVLVGCGTNGGEELDGPTAREKKLAAQARVYIDELAAMVGTRPKVVQDDLADCVPNEDESGQESIYFVHVHAKPGVRGRLDADITRTWVSRGWTPRADGPLAPTAPSRCGSSRAPSRWG